MSHTHGDKLFDLQLLEDWTQACVMCEILPTSQQLFVNQHSDNFDFPELLVGLRSVQLRDAIELPPSVFGSLGESFIFLTHAAFLWLMPVGLRLAIRSDESGFARTIIHRIELELRQGDINRCIVESVRAKTRKTVLDMSLAACELGWDDPRRRTTHQDALVLLLGRDRDRPE